MSDQLTIVHGADVGRTIPIDGELIFGRAVGGPADFGDDVEVSRQHARITRSGDALVLEDLGSTNGTFLNGWRIPSPQILRPGDRIQVGARLLELSGRVAATQQRSAILPGLAAPPAMPAPEDFTLYARGVAKSYGNRPVLHGIDLEVRPGEIVGLLGHNGAGKTTFVSIVAGLRPADGGTVLVSGVDALRDPVAARRRLGIAPQELGMYPILTVRRNLEFFGEMAGLSGAALHQRVNDVADQLSLTPLLDRRAGAMSGGEKRRLHTGMAMVHHPPLLILDEPTVGADVRTRREILDTVRWLASQGHGVIYSTHYLPEVEELGASVAILQGGQIIARGSIAELIASHSTQAVELHFDGVAPQLDMPGATVDGATLRIITDEPDVTAAQALSRLGNYTHRLRGVDIIRPSLESVYLALTEQRYSAVQDVPPDAAYYQEPFAQYAAPEPVA